MKKIVSIVLVACSIISCTQKQERTEVKKEAPFTWNGANVYFLLTDRFNNGDVSNDINFDRTEETAKLRGFKGGDIKGITQKIKNGYFTNLGINAIWMTPIVEQIHGSTDEGTGVTYGYHGYWTSDWTNLDPNFGTREDLKELVETAHKNKIRILLDAVINHTGPVTDIDPVWPNEWVRTTPVCAFDTYENTVTCTLVKNLPDIKTESNKAVELPPRLVEKWKEQGRYDQEIAELDVFFQRTGYPRAARFYIMKWLTDYISEFGIDGYRVDTVKHTEEFVWQEFKKECDYAFAEWKNDNPNAVLDDTNFYLVGEVYNYGIGTGKTYDFGDKTVNYFDNAFHSLINFDLKLNAKQMPMDAIFTKYDSILNNDLKGYSTLNYLSSHDDGQPFDPKREDPYNTATLLLLTPGASQVYYGDESARSLVVEGTNGDATLRSLMNWEAIEKDSTTQIVLTHWQKLGQFRANHPAVGAGRHHMISKKPYVFSRSFVKDAYVDNVMVGLDLPFGEKTLDVSTIFNDGDELFDGYSGISVEVNDGKAEINSDFDIVLLERK
jgi:alpha-amylase